jgi:Fe-S cluster assembly protein SufD
VQEEMKANEHRFVTDQLAGVSRSELPFLASLQESGRERLSTLTAPRGSDETWRFAKLRDLLGQSFHSNRTPVSVGVDVALACGLPETETSRLVFLDGRFWSEASNLSGVTATAGAAEHLDADTRRVLDDLVGREAARFGDDFLVSLNDACAQDIAWIVVPPDTAVEHPIHLLNLHGAGESGLATHNRAVVIVGRGSKVTLVEESVGVEDGTYLANNLIEIVVGDDATVHHMSIQRDSDEAFHTYRAAACVGRGATYDSTSISTGARWSRRDVYVHHAGEGGTSRIDGFAWTHGQRLADTHSVLDHAKGQCRSRQLHKCVADERGRAVFNGRILVREDAQQTKAYQLNRNLLRSSTARVDTKPQLEIFADDVECTHGATIGQLDDDAIFYLQSRGFSAEKARDVLTYAFAEELLETIELPSLVERLSGLIRERMA